MLRGNRIEQAVFGISLVLLIAGAASGDWNGGMLHAAHAAHVEHQAAAPLYGLVADVANLVPVGEPVFRLALLSAVLGAATLAGVAAAARVLVPKDPAASVIAVIIIGISPAFRDAAAFASPAMLAALGTVWAFAWSCRRRVSPRHAVASLAACAVTIGSAPWLGLFLTLAVVAKLARDRVAPAVIAVSLGTMGLLVIVWSWSALGRLPELHDRSTELVAALGLGSTVVVVGLGLLGLGFGAATGLAGMRWLAAVVAIAAVHGGVVGGDAVVVVMLGIAIAVIPAAIVRTVLAPDRSGETHTRRHYVAMAGGVPLIAAALLTGPALSLPDDAESSPAQLADDLWAQMPPGPGVFVATRGPSWIALRYARDGAGARPDLALLPHLRDDTDVAIAEALRNERVAGADAASFGRLEPRRALPRGRGFEMLATPPDRVARVQPPARYNGSAGARVSVGLALSRALYEADTGRLDAAARAAGLDRRFNAADLAVLAKAVPTTAHPAMFGFVPIEILDPEGPWVLDLMGDDLAWVAGLAPATLAPDAPASRRLLAAWQRLWSGAIAESDPSITSLGPAAIAATTQLLGELRGAEKNYRR